MSAKQDQRRNVDGCLFPKDWNPLECQLSLFRYAPQLQADPFWRPNGKRSTIPYSGGGRYSHCRAVLEMICPSFEFSPWAEQQLQVLCEHSQVAFVGAAGSGKSHSTGAYALVFALSGLLDSTTADTTVLIASTTIQAAIQRIWKSCSMLYREAVKRCGGAIGQTMTLGKPRPEIRANPKDLSHGIFVVPVAAGDVQKGVDELKGRHPKRLLLIGDETDSISQAIVEVQDNLRVGTEEFQSVWLGNLPSMFNPLGKIMEPAPNTPVSEACGLEWTSTTGVHCLRFDGELSPNITGEEKWSGLPRQRDIDATLRRNQGVKGQQYYIMVKGLPPPDGVDDTVLSEATLNRFHVLDGVTWASSFILSAALDASIGGDACILKTFRRGQDTHGVFRVFMDETYEVPFDATSIEPAEFQIAKKVQDFCVSRSVKPEEFIGDSTGTTGGAMRVLKREWSHSIEMCEFGGLASSRPVSSDDPRPCSEVYDRRVTELWFSIREFVHADMIRGMDLTTARQLTQRKHETKNRKYCIEQKADMKARGLDSPDHGDCLACYVELLRRKGINAAPTGPATEAVSEAWEETAAQWEFEGPAAAYSGFG